MRGGIARGVDLLADLKLSHCIDRGIVVDAGRFTTEEATFQQRLLNLDDAGGLYLNLDPASRYIDPASARRTACGRKW